MQLRPPFASELFPWRTLPVIFDIWTGAVVFSELWPCKKSHFSDAATLQGGLSSIQETHIKRGGVGMKFQSIAAGMVLLLSVVLLGCTVSAQSTEGRFPLDPGMSSPAPRAGLDRLAGG